MGYSALAPYYDRVMAHVDYSQWADLIDRVCSRFLRRRQAELFEIGAGTGSLARLLLTRGYRYTGSDLSYHMCLQAHGKAVPLICADGRNLPLHAAFDLVLFLYDGINYLFAREEYLRLFSEVHRVLRPGGLFLFDVTTQTNSLTYFQDRFESEDFDDCQCMRHSRYDRIDNIQYNDFTLFVKDKNRQDLFVRLRDAHAQKVLPWSTIKRWIPRDRFGIAGVWDGFSFSRATRASERVHFLLTRM